METVWQEDNGERVKALSFHHTKPWLAVGCSDGTIQIYDHEKRILEHTLFHYTVMTCSSSEHGIQDHGASTTSDPEAPLIASSLAEQEVKKHVRGLDFHRSKPLLVSAGDDRKLRLWNCESGEAIFTIHNAHDDYIRSVQFHATLPWILSASDDLTLRLWDYQQRVGLAVVEGHNHYVMCAAFHPTENWLASASLDRTVRVWDFTNLRQKQAAILHGQHSSPQAKAKPQFLFGVDIAKDVQVKFVLEGHERGVNWVAFHPTLPLLASAADDRKVKIWRMTGEKAGEVADLSGHGHNVSCCLFHHEHLLSAGEDGDLRLWPCKGRKPACLGRVKANNNNNEKSRFWALANHATKNLVAAGHDRGFMVIKVDPTKVKTVLQPLEVAATHRERKPGRSEWGGCLCLCYVAFVLCISFPVPTIIIVIGAIGVSLLPACARGLSQQRQTWARQMRFEIHQVDDLLAVSETKVE